ncbi:MAG: HEAT repeat domain-containing protein [Candidatus Nealsonbacteria bacterium]|nr:HEAT repeat domain-containing protein [Candidatus Nealsonbacteria bacterium]
MMKHRSNASWQRAATAAIAILTVLTITAPAAEKKSPAIEKASWIWRDTGRDVVCQLRTAFTLDAPPTAASIMITADNGYELYINGASVGFDVGAGAEIWNSLERYDVKARLAQGRNVIGIRGICLGGSRGLIAAVRIDMPGGKVLEILTDGSWRTAVKGKPEEYSHPEFLEDEKWAAAGVLGPMGMEPWGQLTYAGSTGGRRQGALPSVAALIEPEADFRWPGAVAFIGDDCSVYTPLRGDAWGICFRVNNWSRAYTEFDIPCPSKIGRKLYALDPVRPGAKPRLLVDAGRGAIGSPSVSYDGRSIYVAMAADGESFYHIYRVPAAGGKPVRLTDGPFHDIDPAELPNGEIVFTSTRVGTFEEYHNPPSRALFVMRDDGSNIRQITSTPTFDNEAKVTADGRIAFIRTDNFFDRGKVETQIHVMRPDGTDGLTELGADVGADYGVRLRQLGYGSPAPLPDGRLACISSRGNFIATPGAAESSFHRLPGGLGDLAPLPDGRLLATVLRPDVGRMSSDVLAVLDPGDNLLVSVYESPDGSIHSPVYLGPRPRPPVLADRVDHRRVGHPDATGFLLCQNVRFTRKTKADWKQIRAIRVLGAKALTTRSSHSHIVHAGHETVELGTVPIAPDGSFAIEVPADMPLALQAVDAEGRSELNEMSWIYVRPGEHRSCLGCHHPRDATPPRTVDVLDATRTRPLRLLGQGNTHHFRGNNSGVTGMMDLQFERFRETASLNLYPESSGPATTGRQEIARLIRQLGGADASLRISAAGRLAIFRDRAAAAALAERLQDTSREVRVAAAMALSACGTCQSVPALLDALEDSDAVVAQAAAVALENLTGHAEPFQPFATAARRQPQVDAWRAWFRENPWEKIERSLIQRIASEDRATKRRAIVALGHTGGDAARAALRQYVARERNNNPYPPFVNNNRTDRFTFSADSPLNPRTIQEATRALGYLHDTDAVPLLREILAVHVEPKTGNLFLAEAAIDALGRIGTPEAESVLIDTFGKLQDYVHYVGWYSDHPALYGSHASPLHARTIAALDYVGSTHAASIVPNLIRSVPNDPDRALFPQSDTYETLTGRVIRRSGRAEELIETCLALLGDPQAVVVDDLKVALSTNHGVWAGTPAPDNRAAQLLSAVCRDRKFEPRLRAAYDRYRAKPEDKIARPLGNPSWIPQRHWVLFYLGRTLGNLGDPQSVDTLCASLVPALNEARHGRPDPSEPNIHFLQLEYTPCWRAAAAWGLGQIGDRRAVPVLLAVVANLDNATDTRHAAAEALGNIADPASLEAIRKLAEDYPEVSTRRALLKACDRCQQQARTAAVSR